MAQLLRCLFFLFLALIPLFCANAQQENPQNQTLFSQHLNENRVVQIHLPKSYRNTNKTYPVLFVLDGEYVFNYARGAVDFLSNDFGFLPEMIVVGIPNTDRNRDLFVDLNPDGTYLNFADFVEKELVLYIDGNYRTNGFNILYGWSSASGMANYIFVKNPSLFKGYILSGAGIGPKTEGFIKSNIKQNDYKRIHLFASAESSFREAGLKKHEKLLQDINPVGLCYKFKIYDHLSHVEVLSQGLYDGLKFVFNDFYVPGSIVSNGSKTIISYYQKLEKSYGFKVDIPIGAINEICANLTEQNKEEEALQLLDYGLRIHSNNPILMGTMAEVYHHQNQSKLAAKYYRQAFQQAKDSVTTNKYRVLYKSALNTQNQK